MSVKVHLNLRSIADHSYDIVIGMKLRDVGIDLQKRWPRSTKFVVTDSKVAKLYGQTLLRALRGSGDLPRLITFPMGEHNKTRLAKERIENKLLRYGVNRSSLLIALGGGVAGDLAGFTAATLLRGIPCVQIPTSLLAQVDSSIGGKVGVDHPLGKNLIGAFHQPKRVYIDVGLLRTLPRSEFSYGMAEVIKYGVTMDRSLFDYLEKHSERILERHEKTVTKVITRCCELKRDVVQLDEKESGYRRILNFGHTIGHAVELVTNYSIPHGRAVSLGMVSESVISATMGIQNQVVLPRLKKVLELYGLPTRLPASISPRQLFEATQRDKKVIDGAVGYTLLRDIGSSVLGVKVLRKDFMESITVSMNTV